MRRASPDAAGFAPGRALSELGRARRFEIASGGELFRLSADDERVALRLLALGAHGIGGFASAGQDDDGIWLVRSPADPTLSSFLRGRSLSWKDALSLGLSLSAALAHAEGESLFPGPLSPSDVSVREGNLTVELRAEALVRSLLGAHADEGGSGGSASPRWIAPEQAAGAPWDNAANRYVLGLILYRMLSGEHAFSGKGLRLGLEEQARRAPPPFADEVARELPPGLMSFCLRLLDPEPKARPRDAAEIHARLGEWLAGEEPERRSIPPVKRSPVPAAPERPARAAAPHKKRSRLRGFLSTGVPPLAGVALAAVVLLAFRSETPAPEQPLERPPLAHGEVLAADCASCHPRQAGEWHRSVMAHSVKSPLFQALEILIEEQVGRDRDCPDGAGILRKLDPRTACRDRQSGLPVTGSGGEHWCVNCHAPAENLALTMPAWDGRSALSPSRRPLRDLLGEQAMEGISCGFCHQVHGPVQPGNRYQGNPFWTSTRTGERFAARPEDGRGLLGIANSGYSLDVSELLGDTSAGGVHGRPSDEARQHLQSSAFCGACHDVRLFGTDVIGVRERGEHFKRLRNAYSEWASWAETERRAGREPASCQDCHMSTFPGVCVSGAGPSPGGACPPGTHFEPRAPGSRALGRVATASASLTPLSNHYFSGVDLPLAEDFPDALIDEPTADVAGTPLGARQRRDLLLAASVRLDLGQPSRRGRLLEVPVTVENVGAGHRVPAGFSQERELWLHLRVSDARGRTLYEVGRVDRPDEDLHDKRFLRVTSDDRFTDGLGRPQGLFGADVSDGPDAPRWDPNPALGGTQFRGRGLVNFQNGFLRCVVCIGTIDSFGRCEPLPGQDRTRADRFADGAYDIDTGECRSNLSGMNALFETYFPVGALDSSRGAVKGPDAIIDTRSLAPGVPVTYSYELSVGSGPVTVEAELLFRAFPPYLLRAFIEYEKNQARAGKRPSGPLITERALERLEVVELGRARAVAP